LMAGATVAVAGAISMAAGVYVSSGSEKEVERNERGKARFLGKPVDNDEPPGHLVTLAALVGCSYLAGSMVPVLPVLLGAKSIGLSIVSSALMIIAVSTILSFLSGMNVRKRIAINVIVIFVAVGVSSLIGLLARQIWGINL
jgi:vacuolar iron transporter family protein